MTLALAAAPIFAPFARARTLFGEWRRREPLFAAAALAHLFAMAPVLAAMVFDERLYLDGSVWEKPLKFLVSLALWFGFLAWAAGWLPEGTAARRWWRPWAVATVVGATFEMVWLGAAAAMGVPSHFNPSPLWFLAFNLAGIVATFLMTAGPVYGLLMLGDRSGRLDPAFRLSAILGFLLAFPLTLGAAFTLAANGGHFVGAAGAQAAGLPLMGWAREGGDLRVAHFFALHAMHVMPVAGWLAARALPERAARGAVWAAAALWAALAVHTFAQALAGRPFLPFL